MTAYSLNTACCYGIPSRKPTSLVNMEPYPLMIPIENGKVLRMLIVESKKDTICKYPSGQKALKFGGKSLTEC